MLCELRAAGVLDPRRASLWADGGKKMPSIRENVFEKHWSECVQTFIRLYCRANVKRCLSYKFLAPGEKDTCKRFFRLRRKTLRCTKNVLRCGNTPSGACRAKPQFQAKCCASATQTAQQLHTLQSMPWYEYIPGVYLYGVSAVNAARSMQRFLDLCSLIAIVADMHN